MARNQVRLDLERREPCAGGGSFGNTGPYGPAPTQWRQGLHPAPTQSRQVVLTPSNIDLYIKGGFKPRWRV